MFPSQQQRVFKGSVTLTGSWVCGYKASKGVKAVVRTIAVEVLVTLSFIFRPEMRFHSVNEKPSADSVGTFNST